MSEVYPEKFAMLGLTYDDVLLVPGGRSIPAAFDRRTGKLLYFELNAGGKGTGGSFVAANEKRGRARAPAEAAARRVKARRSRRAFGIRSSRFSEFAIT